MKRLIIVIACALMLSGCKDGVVQVTRANVAANEQTLKSGASTLLGQLPDGREVRRYVLMYNEPNSQYSREHYVYIVDQTATVTTNYKQVEGKQTFIGTNAVVYDGGALTEEQLMKLASEVKQKREDAERAEYDRLKLKYEGK